MTKYSKMKKSSFAILALSLILVAVFAFGGTYAYFSDNVTANGGNVTTATLTLTDSVSITASTDDLVPGQTLAIEVGDVALTGTTVSAVRFGISNVELSGGQSATLTEEQKGYLTVVAEEAAADATGWVKHTDGYYYWNAYVVELDVAENLTVSIALKADAENEWQGITATFSITFEAEQAEYRVADSANPEFVITEAAALFD